MLQSHLLIDTVRFAASDTLLILNSASDPFVAFAQRQLRAGALILAEDHVAALEQLMQTAGQHAAVVMPQVRHVAFHDYILHHATAHADVAVMNLLYQPANSWMLYGLRVAARALRPRGRLYVLGAKERGILTIGKHMQELFGNLETLEISKGQRVLCSQQNNSEEQRPLRAEEAVLPVFASNKLDEGTRLLIEALEVHVTDHALDIGCGAGFLGLHIARKATQGMVTMVDASLAAVASAQQAIAQSGLSNVQVLASDATRAVQGQRFDLIVTNPPFHQGGIQTTKVAERFIQEAAPLLRPRGRFYLVANRFLKYEPVLRAHFAQLEEVGGDSRYKVLRASPANPSKAERNEFMW